MSAPKPLRVLFVEDSEDDQQLLLRELRRGGFSPLPDRVETEGALHDALDRQEWDLIISDYSLPMFDAPRAVATVRGRSVDCPLIVVSGTVGEDTAVKVLKAGADDFVLKGHLARFLPAVERELREAAIRREKRAAEDAARDAELRFRRIVETAQEGIWMIGPGGQTDYVNERMAAMLGATRQELRERTLLDVIDDIEVEAREKVTLALMRRGGEALAERLECQLTRLDGSALWASIAINPIDDGSGQPLGHLVMAVDVTAQRKLQEQLIVSDRMASVGALAAGVAHEINNPLAVILANLHLATDEITRLITKLDRDTRTNDLTDEMRDASDAAERVRCIVRDLKIFSRSQEQTGPIDVHPVIDSSLRMAWNEIRHRARIVRAYRDVPEVEGSDSRLGQVFLNLITNAAHAMEEGQADRNQLTLGTSLDRSGRVVVEVSDTGAGMTPEVQRRIFTPFFTTKPVGVGTGLGLPICDEIVRSLGGEITVESRIGEGTTFRVFLPRARGKSAPLARPSLQPIKAPRRARILVVDDEIVVGNSLRRLLSGEHDVTTVSSAAEMLERVRNGERFDLVLCDLMMPEVTGMDLFVTLSRDVPDQAARMIFITGGAFTPRAREFLAQVTNPRLEKPFEPSGLRDLVNTRLMEQARA